MRFQLRRNMVAPAPDRLLIKLTTKCHTTRSEGGEEVDSHRDSR